MKHDLVSAPFKATFNFSNNLLQCSYKPATSPNALHIKHQDLTLSLTHTNVSTNSVNKVSSDQFCCYFVLAR